MIWTPHPRVPSPTPARLPVWKGRRAMWIGPRKLKIWNFYHCFENMQETRCRGWHRFSIHEFPAQLQLSSPCGRGALRRAMWIGPRAIKIVAFLSLFWKCQETRSRGWHRLPIHEFSAQLQLGSQCGRGGGRCEQGQESYKCAIFYHCFENTQETRCRGWHRFPIHEFPAQLQLSFQCGRGGGRCEYWIGPRKIKIVTFLWLAFQNMQETRCRGWHRFPIHKFSAQLQLRSRCGRGGGRCELRAKKARIPGSGHHYWRFGFRFPNNTEVSMRLERTDR